MAQYRVYATVSGGTSLGKIEADSEEEALQQATDEHDGTTISLCHHCSHKISDPTIENVTVDLVGEGE